MKRCVDRFTCVNVWVRSVGTGRIRTWKYYQIHFDISIKKENRPLVVIAGKEYGTGSSRDWAAKGSFLLGVKAVIAESFERIHRSNLVGMGVLPLTFQKGESRKTFALKGSEKITILGLENGIKPKMLVDCKIDYIDGTSKKTKLICRIDTEAEVEYFANGGILHNMIKKIVG